MLLDSSAHGNASTSIFLKTLERNRTNTRLLAWYFFLRAPRVTRVRFRAQGLQPRFISEYNWATLQATLHIGYLSPTKLGWEAVESHKQKGVSGLFTNFGHFPVTNDSWKISSGWISLSVLRLVLFLLKPYEPCILPVHCGSGEPPTCDSCIVQAQCFRKSTWASFLQNKVDKGTCSCRVLRTLAFCLKGGIASHNPV